MLDISKIKVSHLPKATKLLEVSDGYFTIDELGTIRMYQSHKPDQDLINSLWANISELEQEIELCQDSEDIRMKQRELSKLERQFSSENAPYWKQSTQCEWVCSQWDLERWLSLASNASQNTLYSVARATGWTHPDDDIDNNLPVYPWTWIYTWKKKA